jgi:small conductance mechanosensitive channel
MDIFKAGSLGQFWNHHAENALMAAARILVIVVAYVIVRFVLSKLTKSVLSSNLARLSGDILQARKARLRALQSVLMSAVSFILGFVAVIMILQAAGINPLPLLTTASVAGLAIGFGAQKLVKDVISGFFILMEDHYGVGDFVTISGVSGLVESLEMRTTRIRDGSGKLYILSNGDISQVCNHSRGRLTMSVEYALAPTVDPESACAVIAEVGAAMPKDFPKEVKEAFRCDGLAQITGTSIGVRVTGVVSAASQDMVKMELNKRVREALAKNGIGLA